MEPAYEVYVAVDFTHSARKAVRRSIPPNRRLNASPNLEFQKLLRKKAGQTRMRSAAARSISIPRAPQSKFGPEKTFVRPP
jgi:hypothetical protein